MAVSTSTSGPATSVRQASPAPSKNSARWPTSTSSKSGTSVPPRPAPAQTPTPPTPMAPAVSAISARAATSTTPAILATRTAPARPATRARAMTRATLVAPGRAMARAGTAGRAGTAAPAGVRGTARAGPVPAGQRGTAARAWRPRSPSPFRGGPGRAARTPPAAGGFGLLDPETARDLVAAAARHPGTRWCYTVLHPDGTAAAHACALGRHPGGPPDPRTLKFNTVIRGPCNHAQAQESYRPSRKLRHLITARNATCTAPGCGHAAANCDLDHTTPWHLGGVTCACNLAPLCRHHHRVKQAQGWWLEQSEPGVLVWRTPAGRTHTTTPTVYPL